MHQMKSPPQYSNYPPHWPPRDRLSSVETTLRDHAIILHGFDGENGLRGNQKTMTKDLAELKKWRHRQDVQLQTLFKVGRWLAICVIILFGFFGPEAVVDRFLALWKSAKSLTGG